MAIRVDVRTYAGYMLVVGDGARYLSSSLPYVWGVHCLCIWQGTTALVPGPTELGDWLDGASGACDGCMTSEQGLAALCWLQLQGVGAEE